MSKCKKCKTELFFAKTAGGSNMPLDPEPVEDGNVVIREGIVRVLKQDEQPAPGELRYVSHFVTCANAEAFRRPPRKKNWDKALGQHDRSRQERRAR